MRKLFILIICLGILALGSNAIVACSPDDLFDCDDCNDEIDDAVDKYGAADDVSLMEWNDGTWCYDMWWYDRGLSIMFCQWDSCGCDISTYYDGPPAPM